MISKPRFTLMTATVLMVFVFSALWTVPAFADDSTPPPAEPTAEVTPEVEQEVVQAPAESTEVPSTESVVVTDEAAPTEPVVVTDETAPAEEPVTVTEALEQLPEGTEVQVLDENGETLPLATQEAADAVVEGDPIWCPAGVAPKSGVGGCSTSYTSLQDLIDDLKFSGGSVFNPAKAGVIWIAYNYNNTTGNDVGITEFILDGDDFNDGDAVFTDTMDNFALTIKGGWNGISGSTVINQSTPSQFVGASLHIINWKGNITISDILITDAVTDTDLGENTFALLVETSKNIQLDRVTVKRSENVGAGNDAMTGAKLNNANSTISSTVIVNNSIFEDNEGDGLLIQSAGIVTITTIFADGNDANGVVIDNTHNPSLTAPDKAVTLKGSLEFHNNSEAGLRVSSKGLITIGNVNASQNGVTGAALDNSTSKTLLGVTIKGTNNFTSNGIGLDVNTHGAITANSINASNNGGTGAILDNCDKLIPNGNCLALIAKTVKLTGYNTFNNNDNHGLEVTSFGSITVANLMASGNTGTGVILDNQTTNDKDPVQVDSVGTIVQTGYGIFNDNNAGDGLRARSHGNITLTNLTATNNGDGLADGIQIGYFDLSDSGVEVNSDKANIGAKIYVANVTISGLNYFAGNNSHGLLVNADGKVTVSNINATSNIVNGAEFHTTDLGYGVTLTGTNTFIDNGATGLVMDVTGAIVASNVTALYNQTGASLDNQYITSKLYAVALSGTNAFNFNDGDGLIVNSYGAISVNNLNANGNGRNLSDGNGATLDNCNISGNACLAVTAAAVNLNGYVNVRDNEDRGLEINSLGAVTLNNVVATENGNVGVRIENKFNPTYNKAVVRGVTIKGTNIFSNNDSSGLYIKSYGAISLINISANNNGDNTSGAGSGAYLDNSLDRTLLQPEASIVAKNITITGVNTFNGNYTFGLKFLSNGTVTLSRITANGNDWDLANGPLPANIGAGVSGTARNITLTCGHMFGNGVGTIAGVKDPAPGYDLRVGLPAIGGASALKGILTIKGIYSSGNNGSDIDVSDPGTSVVGSTMTVTRSCALP